MERLARTSLAFALLVSAAFLAAQVSTPAALARSEGVDAATGIHYLRLYLQAVPASSAHPLTVAASPPSPGTPASFASPDTLDLAQPVLTAQCSATPGGKSSFDLFVNFGSVADTAFYPPWKALHPDTPQPRKTVKTLLTMEFLGYTHVKPVRRQFEYVLAPAGQLHYNPATLTSSNLEDAIYWLRFLRALPTLRISDATHSASFETAPLLDVLHRLTLCRAAGLEPVPVMA